MIFKDKAIINRLDCIEHQCEFHYKNFVDEFKLLFERMKIIENFMKSIDQEYSIFNSSERIKLLEKQNYIFEESLISHKAKIEEILNFINTHLKKEKK